MNSIYICHRKLIKLKIQLNAQTSYTSVKVTPNKIQTLHLYPNPASSIVQLEVSDAMDVREVLVYNSIGQQVEHFSGLPKEIDVERLAPGCYTVVVRYEKEALSSRFVVE